MEMNFLSLQSHGEQEIRRASLPIQLDSFSCRGVKAFEMSEDVPRDRLSCVLLKKKKKSTSIIIIIIII